MKVFEIFFCDKYHVKISSSKPVCLNIAILIILIVLANLTATYRIRLT
jgi:hypothetical protein